MKKIPLTQGQFAIVDDEDYPELIKHKWTAQKSPTTFYARRVIRIKKADLSGDSETICISMARQIMNPPDGFIVDHIDHNGLNCRKKNLRNCTKAQNSQNQKKRTGCSSKYKGVNFVKKANRYYTHIGMNGKYKHLGSYENETDAAKAYDIAARQLFGEFALCNFPE